MTLPPVEFPELVEHYALFFESVFSEQALVQFKRYTSGLMVTLSQAKSLVLCIASSNSKFEASCGRMSLNFASQFVCFLES
ncbi:MAG: hypothetical protein ACFFCW_47070 [Candidatus Hodarchaeota archaeon]